MEGIKQFIDKGGKQMLKVTNNQLIQIAAVDADDIRDILPGSVVEVGTDEDGILEIELDGMDIVSDKNGDIPALWGYDLGLPCNAIIDRDNAGNLTPTSGTVYVLEDDVIVIAPDGWC